MKKWIVIISLLLVLSVACSIYVYTKGRAPYKQAEQYAVNRAKSEAEFTSVDAFYMYHGTETYYVVIGNSEANEETIAWIPKDEKQQIITKKSSEGITEEEAIAKLYQEEKPKKLLGTRLGMEKKLPIWELSYLDNNSKLNYYYIHFDSGKWWRKIENL